MSNDLRGLRDIISSSIDSICSVCERTGRPFPLLDDPVKPSEFTPQGIRNDPSVSRSIGLIVAAATQLIATVQAPSTTTIVSGYGYAMTAALGVIEAGNIAEILRDAGPNGLHVKDIASRSSMDPKKIGRILRYLATQHWFRETNPDVFTNNLLSSTLDSGKAITNEFDRTTKYDNAKGVSALIGLCADELAKCGSYLVEAMTDSKTRFSEEPNCAAVQKAFDMTDVYFEFYDRPTEQYRRKRFAAAMSNINEVNTPAVILSSFDWASLPEGALVVDVGGGLGHVSMQVAKAHPKLRIAIEDRELVIKQAKQFWQENLTSHVSEGKVHFFGTNFFEAQPELPGPVDVFLLRMILHDWSDKYALKILRRLRDSAGPETKLVVIDAVMEHACGSGRGVEKMPAPLLPNMGGANLLGYSSDINVFGVLNAGERTEEGFREILSASGWQLQEICDSSSGIYMSSIICTPV